LKINLTILLLLFFIKSYTQDINAIVNFADSLYNEQKFSMALNEYQRAYFFAENEKKQNLCIQIANCNLALENYGIAKTYCDSAIIYSQTDSLKTACRLHKIVCYLLENNFEYALLKLDEIKTDSNSYFQTRKSLLQGISNLGIEQYDKALQYLNTALNPTDSVKQKHLKQLFKNSKNLKKPSPTLAALMSIVLPGSGQIYSGKYASGLNSLLLLGGLTCLGVYSPGLNILVAPLFSRYYMGGILHANKFAKEKKMLKQAGFASEILTLFPGNEDLKPIFGVKQNEMNFHKHILDSDAEIPLLISASFMAYKNYFSSQDVDACVFSPTCSVYMMETVKKYGLVTGFLDGLDRLMRCHAFVHKNDYNYNKNTDKYNDPN